MTFSSMTPHGKGLLLTAFGGLMLSFDTPLVRLGDGTVWSVIALRSLSTFAAAILAWSVIRLFTAHRPALVPGRRGLLAGLFYGIATVTFLASIYYTEVANTVFILACSPMICALLSWIFMKAKPSGSTLLTMAIMLAGVSLIVGSSLSGGHLFGDMLAAIAALSIASAITVSRGSDQPMGFTPLVAALVPGLIALAIALPQGFQIANPGWILFDGAIMMPLAFWCLATGPRYLSGPEVGMFYLLETVLAPIWIGLIFAEIPSTMTLTGGAILILALIGHSLWQLRQRPAAATTALSG